MSDEKTLISVKRAAELCGVSTQTMRNYSKMGRIPTIIINERGDRRYTRAAIREFLGETMIETQPLRVALYVRVSGGDQKTSLETQETELRKLALMSDLKIVGVFKDKASGLNEKRPGLLKLLKLAEQKEIDLVWVTHKDRLARFGVSWIEYALSLNNVQTHALYDQENKSAQTELVDDFIKLTASFSGKLYGQRSAANRKRLLAEADSRGDS